MGDISCVPLPYHPNLALTLSLTLTFTLTHTGPATVSHSTTLQHHYFKSTPIYLLSLTNHHNHLLTPITIIRLPHFTISTYYLLTSHLSTPILSQSPLTSFSSHSINNLAIQPLFYHHLHSSTVIIYQITPHSLTYLLSPPIFYYTFFNIYHNPYLTFNSLCPSIHTRF